VGIDLNTAQLLIKAHKNGVSFGRMATLGRQRLLGNRQALISVLRKSGYELPRNLVRRLLDPTTEYAEDFLSLLGANEIVAIDASDFEGAQILHDMNRPIPDSLVSSFDLVLDGGTLEHIFDLPTALRNAAQMVRPNGRFISHTMANNFCGHGFYQFSPELFYRFLCPRNGYAMESCIIWEDTPRSRFYQVPDPDSVQSRINLTSEVGTFMVIQAKRLGDVPREFVPQQSDYVRLWEGGPTEAVQHSSSLAKLKSILKRIPTMQFAVRKLLRFQERYIAAEYRRLRIKRNAQGVLTPLKDLRVICGGYFR
jgi:SAM-dependent methyltransferase